MPASHILDGAAFQAIFWPIFRFFLVTGGSLILRKLRWTRISQAQKTFYVGGPKDDGQEKEDGLRSLSYQKECVAHVLQLMICSRQTQFVHKRLAQKRRPDLFSASSGARSMVPYCNPRRLLVLKDSPERRSSTSYNPDDSEVSLDYFLVQDILGTSLLLRPVAPVLALISTESRCLRKSDYCRQPFDVKNCRGYSHPLRTSWVMSSLWLPKYLSPSAASTRPCLDLSGSITNVRGLGSQSAFNISRTRFLASLRSPTSQLDGRRGCRGQQGKYLNPTAAFCSWNSGEENDFIIR
ncbi:hypothetical protein DFH06DRAFT_1438952 [Mycena polygramma]|nr:hypothetical protein DFH06DRAFT_1438952 [Mycena polygramma]